MRRVVVKAIVFLVFAVGITWAAGSVVLLSDQASLIGGRGHPVLPLPAGVAFTLILVADIGPAVAGLVTMALFDGRRGVVGLLGQFARWRIAWYWYAAALVGPTVVSVAGVAAFVATGGRMDASWIALQPGRIVLTAVGGWGEELGWRGFAQPTLQARLGALGAAVVVGIMWTAWHTWQVIAPGGAVFAWDDAAWNLLRLVSVSILIAWIYNSTRGSLPSAVAAHVGINAVALSPYPTPFVVGAFAAAALLVVVITGPRSLVRRGLAPPA